MSIFDKKRLTDETFKLDIERMRKGWYSDKYFENIGRMLESLSAEGYSYSGAHHNLPMDVSPEDFTQKTESFLDKKDDGIFDKKKIKEQIEKISAKSSKITSPPKVLLKN